MPISGKLANLQLNRAPAQFVKEYVIEKKAIQNNPSKKIVNNTQEGLCRKLGHIFCYNCSDRYGTAYHS